MEPTPKISESLSEKAIHWYTRSDVRVAVEKINDDYLYWSDAKYRPLPDGMSAEELWAVVKFSRRVHQVFEWPKYHITVSVTNFMQRVCHDLDMNFGGSWGSGSLLPEEGRERYLISSLMEEAISSSQMEGASTTRRVAKDMLRRNQSPKDRSQQMILNNYRAIQYLVEHKENSLNEGFILNVHRLMTFKTMKDPEDSGRFRSANDDIRVANEITGEIVHTPPASHDIPMFINELCDFVNNEQNSVFIHPIIKAIILHFMIAYVHPFVDGNGRTARALFYWYMLKQGYWLMEYLSISRIIYRSKVSYENAFLCTENDGMDMGYFINYHLKVMSQSFKELREYIQRKRISIQETALLPNMQGLNHRQIEILTVFNVEPETIMTVKEVQNRFGISDPTARQDLTTLVGKGLLREININKVKKGFVKVVKSVASKDKEANKK